MANHRVIYTKEFLEETFKEYENLGNDFLTYSFRHRVWGHLYTASREAVRDSIKRGFLHDTLLININIILSKGYEIDPVYTYDKVWETQYHNFKARHLKCGRIVEKCFNHFKDYGCAHCSTNGTGYSTKRVTVESFKERLAQRHDNEITVDTATFVNMSTNVEFTHKCGYKWEAKPYSVVGDRLNGCPACASSVRKKPTRIEQRVLDFVNSIRPDLNFERNIRFGKGLHRLEIDIYSKSAPHVGIEIHGLRWHADMRGDHRALSIPRKQRKFAKDNQIHIFNIYEDQLATKEKRDIVFSRLQNFYAEHLNTRFFARKLTIKIIDTYTSAIGEFLDINHIQGKDKHHSAVALMDGDEIISVMTFVNRSLQGKKNAQTELSRFASKKYTTVVGGFERLFKHAINEFKFADLVSYMDLNWSFDPRDWTDESVYARNGFKLESVSDNQYWYIKVNGTSTRLSRLSFQKHKLEHMFPEYFDHDLSEKEIMKAAGYACVYGCGNARYRWAKK